MAHLKRYAMPKEWPLARKRETWIVRPVPGPHTIGGSIPLQVLIRDILKLAETAREARSILREEKVMVDKKARKDPKFPVGLMDVIEIPEIKKQFRVIAGRKGLEFDRIAPDETNTKLCRINGKTVIRGGVQQLNLHDGRSILVGKRSPYRCGDSVLIEMPSQRIIRHYPLEKGGHAFISAGRNMGAEGVIKKVSKKKSTFEKSTVLIESGGKGIETLIEYVFPGSLKIAVKVKPAKAVVKKAEAKAKPKTKPKRTATKSKAARKAKQKMKKGGKR